MTERRFFSDLFRDKPAEAPAGILALFDNLYRITEEEFNDILVTHFDVKVVHLHHRFLSPPDKIGVNEDVYLFSDKPSKYDRYRKEAANADAIISVRTERNHTVFEFTSARQDLLVVFQHTATGTIWPNVAKRFSNAINSILLYLANRFRAAEALAKQQVRETSFFDSIQDTLHRRYGTDSLCGMLADRFIPNDISTSIHLYNPLHKHAITIGTSEGHVPFDTALNKIVSHTLTLHTPFRTLATLNCSRAVAILPFGRHDLIFDNYPRGAICVSVGHTDEEILDTIISGSRLVWSRVSREIAAYVDELDEKLEHTILTNTISSAAMVCSYSLAANRGNIFSLFVVSVSKYITEYASKISPTYLSRAVPPDEFMINFEIDGRNYGNIPEHILERFRGNNAQNGLRYDFFPPTDDTDIATLHFRTPTDNKPITLSFRASTASLCLIRAHVLKWIAEIMHVAHHFFYSQEQRKSWMHRTMHEIRHPLQGLVSLGDGLAFLCEEGASHQALQREVGDMSFSIQALSVLLLKLENITGLSQLDPTFDNVALHADILRPMRKLLTSYATKHNVELTRPRMQSDNHIVRTDPDLLAFVFYNLLDNAIKYSTSGEKVTTSCTEQTDHFLVSVTNRGEPIDKDDESKIFLQEHRGRNSDGLPGLGLGLHTSNEFAERLNCKLSLDDAGRDSGNIVFSIRIPKPDSLDHS
ncbi:sensor histidine kinase [Rubinisphaera sp. JC750]|uniref:sensor histidine kinase n=1 Tax=Rubinisphaera sp. JC750 TaxID=2898658 RepID=UPI001F19EA6E|nr:HAMP domain-containing sensor histidine kinase [Rubinisphaera sp. JC750]